MSVSVFPRTLLCTSYVTLHKEIKLSFVNLGTGLFMIMLYLNVECFYTKDELMNKHKHPPYLIFHLAVISGVGGVSV